MVPPIARRDRCIAIVGDYDPSSDPHSALTDSLLQAKQELGCDITWDWLPTDAITCEADCAGFGGYWIAPGSPYRSKDGALLSIRYARENLRPLLAT